MSKPSSLVEKAESYLNDAMEMRLNLSLDAAVYNLNYLSEALAMVSTWQERLSDLQMKVTVMSLEIIQQKRARAAILRSKKNELRASDEYSQVPLNEKAGWLENQLLLVDKEAGDWAEAEAIVLEVKRAISERAGTMRRLDSDLRLHSKLYEARVGAGATSPDSYTGNSTSEMDI